MSVTVRRIEPGEAAAIGLPEVPAPFKQEIYAVETHAPPEWVFQVIAHLGGENGWYYGDWLWSLRGLLDRLIGGVGLRRATSLSGSLQPGDALDFWRVEQLEPERVLVLRAEMKIGGEGLLGFYLFPVDKGTLLVQRALFRPTIWLGRVYWLVVYPLHALVFRGLVGAIAERAERISQ